MFPVRPGTGQYNFAMIELAPPADFVRISSTVTGVAGSCCVGAFSTIDPSADVIAAFSRMVAPLYQILVAIESSTLGVIVSAKACTSATIS